MGGPEGLPEWFLKGFSRFLLGGNRRCDMNQKEWKLADDLKGDCEEILKVIKIAWDGKGKLDVDRIRDLMVSMTINLNNAERKGKK
jgi:hypothetical protein